MNNFARVLKMLIMALVVAFVAGTGCKSESGSKEFTPGKGWHST